MTAAAILSLSLAQRRGSPFAQHIDADALPLASKHFFTRSTSLDLESEER